MSNKAFIVRTRFQDLNVDGSVANASYGLRVFDDHEATYDNVLVESEAELLALSKRALVEMAFGMNEKAAGIIEFAEESEGGIYIDGDWITWAEIKAGAPTA